MTHMLDILEDYLELRNLLYSRLDGAMSFTVRQEQVLFVHMYMLGSYVILSVKYKITNPYCDVKKNFRN